MAVEPRAQGQTQERDQQQILSTNPAESGLDRMAMAVRQDSGLQDNHVRDIALQSHRMMLQNLGGPEQALRALESLKSAGAITEGMATIYREALTSAGGDSAKFADTIVQRRQEMADTIARDLTSSPMTALAMLDNIDAGMTATQVEARSRMAYESLLQVNNNDMTAVNASIDRALETGQLNAQNATVIKDAAQRAGTDAARFAQLMSENKDGLAQLALVQAQQGAGRPAGPAAAGGDMSSMFGNMQDNPLMQMFNKLIMAFTGGKMSLESIMQNMQNGPQQQAAGGQTPGPSGTPAGTTTTPGATTTPTGTGAGQDQTATATVAPVVTQPAATDINLTGATTLTGGALGSGTYPGFNFLDDDMFSFGLDSPQFDLNSPSIFRTSFRDDAGFNFGTTPRVNLLSGDMSINGMSPTSRFSMLSNPDPFRISLTDPRVDLTAPNLSETFAKTPDQSADVTETILRVGGPGAR
ncbi:MAG: hypothetical protein KJ017_09565 [Alphaproteobacteria bacterium]|nr:hypothetical protein [Alphaproteobacteria bacterium]